MNCLVVNCLEFLFVRWSFPDGELSGGELFRVSVCPVELPGGELSYT